MELCPVTGYAPQPRLLDLKPRIVEQPDKIVPLVVTRLRDERHEAAGLPARAIRLDLVALTVELEIVTLSDGGLALHLPAVVGFGTFDEHRGVVLRDGRSNMWGDAISGAPTLARPRPACPASAKDV
jgi:hypothetical protein